jgi:hypothetical protein
MTTQQRLCVVTKAAGRGLDREVATTRGADWHYLFETALSKGEVTTVTHAPLTTRPLQSIQHEDWKIAVGQPGFAVRQSLDELKTMWPRRVYRISSAGTPASNKQPQRDGRTIPR